jgi:hypothetical protein
LPLPVAAAGSARWGQIWKMGVLPQFGATASARTSGTDLWRNAHFPDLTPACLSACLALCLAVVPQPARTLKTELVRYHVSVPADVVDIDRPITSYSVSNDAGLFAIGYYEQTADGLLHELRVRALDKRSRVWRSASFDGIGSVLSITPHKGLLYLQGHGSPSAGPLLVLTGDLRQHRALDGWPELFLDDGRVVFQRSMRHFAPTHAAVLAIYDPVANTERTFYPSESVANDRGLEWARAPDLAIDRSIDSVRRGSGPQVIEMLVTEQLRRITPDNLSVAGGPVRRSVVTCDMAGGTPACRVRETPRLRGGPAPR